MSCRLNDEIVDKYNKCSIRKEWQDKNGLKCHLIAIVQDEEFMDSKNNFLDVVVYRRWNPNKKQWSFKCKQRWLIGWLRNTLAERGEFVFNVGDIVDSKVNNIASRYVVEKVFKTVLWVR